MPGTNTQAVAEMTLALMLAAVRRLPEYGRAVSGGRGWAMDAAMQDHLGEIGGRTVGLVGFGAVPRALAPLLGALGARVLYTARERKPEAGGLAEWRALDDLLAESDVLSLHVPLTPETEAMIGADALARMKPGAVLVNTARGGLVDETALIAALRDGRLRAAGLDVFAAEPVDPGNPLLHLDNVVLTPHVAWFTMETIERSLEVAVDNCRRLAAGRPLRFQVA
jgi:phosphoglycerate dehydrogenase-like enzyme